MSIQIVTNLKQNIWCSIILTVIKERVSAERNQRTSICWT